MYNTRICIVLPQTPLNSDILDLTDRNVCRVRMHYGHPDVFDRVFHITRGGISKASRVINISEDIYIG